MEIDYEIQYFEGKYWSAATGSYYTEEQYQAGIVHKILARLQDKYPAKQYRIVKITTEVVS